MQRNALQCLRTGEKRSPGVQSLSAEYYITITFQQGFESAVAPTSSHTPRFCFFPHCLLLEFNAQNLTGSHQWGWSPKKN